MPRSRAGLLLLVSVLASLYSGFNTSAFAESIDQPRLIFGPQQFVRTSGQTDVYTETFSLPSYVSGPYALTVLNGKFNGDKRIDDAISSGSVSINGIETVAPSDFNQNVFIIQRAVSLSDSNALTVTLNSSPDSYITIQISGVIQLGQLNQSRTGHTDSLLADGRILITGGEDAAGSLDSSEVFDPLNLSFSPMSSGLNAARTGHAASVLADQLHLLSAGKDAAGVIASAELFDPAGGLFSIAPETVQIPRYGHSSTVLLDGRVLIAGGNDTGIIGLSEVYDSQDALLFKPPFSPDNASFTVLPNAMSVGRWDHTATLLPDGRVLIIGGRNASGLLGSVEVFDPMNETFSPLPATLLQPRAGHTATLLPDGTVLVLGGEGTSGYLDTGEVLDLIRGTFASATQSFITPRANHTATQLYFGEILIAGGTNAEGIVVDPELVGPPAEDTVSPTVSEVTPAAGAAGVDLTEIIGVRFSEPVDVTTLDASSVFLSGSGTVAATISPSEEGLMAFLVPASDLSPGTTYTLNLTSDITDLAGNPLAVFTASFTTVPAPTITSITPAQGPVGTAVTINGAHFDPTAPPLNIVKFGDTEAVVTSATTTEIATSVPGGVPFGSLMVTVTTRGGTAEVPFTVEDPVPVADAGPDQSVYIGDPVTLDGTGSYDPNGDPLTYQWFLISPTGRGGVPIPVLPDPTLPQPSYVPNFGCTCIFELTVSDGTNTSEPDTVTVEVFSISSYTVTPFSAVVKVGESQAFTATVTYSDGAVNDVTNETTWTSSDETVAAISSSGIATGLKGGSTTILGSYKGRGSGRTLQVTYEIPILNSLSQTSVVLGTGPLNLTVSGENFIPDSRIYFNGPSSITKCNTWQG